MTPRVAPYGSWHSPIDAAAIAGGTHAVEDARFVGDEVWWSERRPTEGGRTGVFRRRFDGAVETVLPAPAGARSRVHEYGGGAWTATSDGTLVYVDARDQRIHRLRPDGLAEPLTPHIRGTSYAEIAVHGDEILAVREHVNEHSVSRDIVAVPLDGSAAESRDAIRALVAGSDFVAYPRISPDGRRLAWIAWDHPRMPWDGTELRVGEVVDGVVPEWRTLLGGPVESVLQPEWRDDETLWCVTDRSGFWNPVLVDTGGTMIREAVTERETGGPLWNLGARWYLPLAADRLLLRSTFGSDRLEVLEADGTRSVLDSPFTSFELLDYADGRVLVRGGGPDLPGGLHLLDIADGSVEIGAVETVRSDFEELPDAAYLPAPVERTFQGEGREVHAVVYPPRNPDHVAPDGEPPPYVTIVHGGPTAHSQASVNPVFAYYTSRGIGVLDVNYGGSTGYGRAYRERLDGEWGVVDVADVETAARGLVAAGEADGARMAIEGSSAGGWTVLSSLVRGDVFACGVSLYGVADLRTLIAATHDFERSYLQGLVGPLPGAEALYVERSPLTCGEPFERPILLLQGLEDPVVPPAQSEQVRDALVAAGVPHAYLTFEGESHGFRRAETRTAVREAALSFYGQILGFTPPSVPELSLWRPDQAVPE
ncbi:S9 family peptidase [Herbiconiux sp. L3-i23]|uniref:alpha/beta hydrolase family protein n=1 Tax=Herbiconiux sp. L3-i23 TaxID=2905871 RepID=UPI002054AA33|nr:prolyl oligopeptidase family serine peptidase [Herbiconiux sp. L3-i23]BDI22946.1 acyl-peptide hydrolase [Herbiconiux sp. L3-i23]